MSVMKVVNRENDGADRLFHVKFADSRIAYLRVKTNSNPLHIHSGEVSGVLGIDERHSSLNEAGDWLLDQIRLKRIQL